MWNFANRDRLKESKSGFTPLDARHTTSPASESVLTESHRDITTQLKAEEALRRSEKLAAMGRMAGIVAHEINNPLGLITNLFYLLREHPSLDEEARNYADMAEAELLRVTHITKQTLGFYRESANIIPVSIAAILDDILEFQSRQIQTNKIIVDRRYRKRWRCVWFSRAN